MDGLLSRPQSLQIRPIQYRVQLFSRRDPGCLRQSHDFLRQFVNQFRYAIVMFDRDGCGQEQRTREELETEVERNLEACGWKDRSAAVVIDPELEAWVWSDSSEVDAVLGWSGREPELRTWLTDQKLWTAGEPKPTDPKDAMQAALREVKQAQSASIFGQLAQRVSLRRCVAPAFSKLRTILAKWFPKPASNRSPATR